MKTLKVSKRSRAINALLDQARKEDVLLRAEDGTQFLVKAIDDFSLEIAAQRQNKKLMAFLDQCGKQKEWVPLEEVERSLGLPPRKGGTRKTNTRGR